MSQLRQGKEVFRYDYVFLAVVLLLTGLGMVTLYSAAYLFAENNPNRFADGMSPLKSNFAACVFALVVVIASLLARFTIEWLQNGKFIVFLLVGTLVANCLPILPFFRKLNYQSGDAMRWIVLKSGGKELFSFQPSELIKVVLPLYLSYILDKNRGKLKSLFYGPLPPVVFTALFCMQVLFLQSNLSEAALIALISFAICLVGGIQFRFFAVVFAVLLAIAGSLIFGGSRDNRWYQRIVTHLNPGSDPFGTGYQPGMSADAVASGGFWGKGIGQGTIKMRMPEVHGDFVFASYAEEFGFVGMLCYAVLFAAFAGICYRSSWRSRNRFTQLVIFSLVTPVVFQTLLNIAVVANAFPVTGVPLPFVSSGGSSLLVTLISSSLLFYLIRMHIIAEKKEGRYAG